MLFLRQRKASTSGENCVPVGVDVPKVPPLGKPNDSKGNASKLLIGGAAFVGAAFVGASLVAYQNGYLGKEKQKLSEPLNSEAVTETPEDLNLAHPGVEVGKAKAPHAKASVGMQNDRKVHPKCGPTPKRYAHISSKTPQESASHSAAKRSPVSSVGENVRMEAEEICRLRNGDSLVASYGRNNIIKTRHFSDGREICCPLICCLAIVAD
ncbi:unnamed protein product [Microthlaspi erraticum]|uniref:Uncharacterized protein n=1 Tax=Microthlaspi erraticum TaxID=1685480 RepID=A0A6D2JMD9_9BRAS|nr:unnamed protein product [Microthlaspi erraticum]